MNMSSNISKNEPLVERVFSFINRHGLILEKETVLVGVSGGPDSVCLLKILVTLRERLGIRLHVAHLNHLLRGTESEADARYVSELSGQLGVTVTLGQREVRTHQTTNHSSLEEAAREVRYQFFAEVAKSISADRIAIGHTADDQAETILMHLVRGSGIYGLQGMHPITELKSLVDSPLIVVRPLLEVYRKEIEAYCEMQATAPRQDSSNLSNSFFRNRVRHELTPLLQSYNPRIKEALLRLADSSAVDASFFKECISEMWDSVVHNEGETFVLIGKEILKLHPSLQSYLFREVVRRLLGNLKDIEWKHIEIMRTSMNLTKGKCVNLPRGLTFYIEQGGYRIAKEQISEGIWD